MQQAQQPTTLSSYGEKVELVSSQYSQSTDTPGNANFDASKIAQIAITFSITMFLSLCLLVTRDLGMLSGLPTFMWFASGLFGAAGIKYIDNLFDLESKQGASGTRRLFILKNPRFRQLHNKAFISIDKRLKSFGFLCFICAWCSFICAYFLIGFTIFGLDMPTSLLGGLQIAMTHWYTGIMAGILIINTLMAVTYEFLFME